MSSRIRTENRRASLAQRLALAPYSVWAVIFVAVPLVFVAYYAFTDESFRFTTENLTKFFTAVSTVTDDSGATREVHTYLLIFWRSVKLAVISTAICLLMGYPIAYIIARAAPRTQKTVITLIMIPMWMNFLIRTYAWMTILQDTGIINGLLSMVGLSPVHVIGTQTAVIIGMVYDYFPYMVLPIYSILVKMDDKLIEAARDLGCNGASVFRRVVFPLSVPGVISGITMVFVPSISTFYISQKLGGGTFELLGDTIERQFQNENTYHVGAAISLVMMILILLSLAVMNRFGEEDEAEVLV